MNLRNRLLTLLDIYHRCKAKQQCNRSCPSPKSVTKMVALQSYVLYQGSSPQLVTVLLDQVSVSSCNTVVTLLENAGQREL